MIILQNTARTQREHEKKNLEDNGRQSKYDIEYER